jgi:hypothetical protein
MLETSCFCKLVSYCKRRRNLKIKIRKSNLPQKTKKNILQFINPVKGHTLQFTN